MATKKPQTDTRAQLGRKFRQSSFRLPEWLIEKIDREASGLGISRNAWLVLTAQSALKQKDAQS
jgi:hypothetical protein